MERIVKNLYGIFPSIAGRAEIFGFHLHQLRHTLARIVSEETGSLSEAQEALGHKNQKTIRVYIESVRIRTERHSSRMKDRIRLEKK